MRKIAKLNFPLGKEYSQSILDQEDGSGADIGESAPGRGREVAACLDKFGSVPCDPDRMTRWYRLVM